MRLAQRSKIFTLLLARDKNAHASSEGQLRNNNIKAARPGARGFCDAADGVRQNSTGVLHRIIKVCNP